MCVSLLERVKQGKSNIILILILSARSQDRDRATTLPHLASIMISIHSVARPRPPGAAYSVEPAIFQSTRSQDRDKSSFISIEIILDFNPLGRKTETIREKTDIEKLQISIHSVARPRQSQTHGRRKRL